MPYFHPRGMISSYPYFLNEFINDFLELFCTLFKKFGRDLIMSSCFSIYQFTYCYLYGYIIRWFNRQFCSFYPHYPLFSTVAGCSIFQFQVLLIIFRPPFRTSSLWLTMLPSLSLISNVFGLNPFLTLFISFWNVFASLLFSVNHFAVGSLFIFYYYLTVFIKPTISLWCFFFFLLYFQLLHLFLFFILFHISFVFHTSSNLVFCTFAVTFLINYYFTSFLFCLPMSHFFISLFLVF